MNKTFKKIAKEFVYGNHLLSLGATGIVLAGAIILGIKIDLAILLIPYLLAQIVYNLDHYMDKKKDLQNNPERSNFVASKKIGRMLTFYTIALFLVLIMWANLQTILMIFAVMLLGALYPKKLTKKIVGFKTIYVAFFWAMALVYMMLYTNSAITASFIVVDIYVFLRFVISTTFFDIKDVEADSKDGLKTFPVVFGSRGVVTFMNIVNIVSTLMIIASVAFELLPIYSLALILFFVYDWYYINFSAKKTAKQLRTLSYVFVDGEYVLWPIALTILELIFKIV